MTPVAFGSAPDECFGWLHQAGGECGIVLCGTIGFEKQIFHRAWRCLAEQLAAAGYPTLRFDYPGSGDSCGTDGDPEALDRWLASIEQAAAWLRANTGARRVILCGIHLGGLLAAVAGLRIHDVERLVLLAPVHSGRAYARTHAIAARLFGAPQVGEHVEANGLSLHKETLRALGPFELAGLGRAPAPRILILSPGLPGAMDAVAAALAERGAETTLRDMPDFLDLSRPAHESEVPATSFDSIIEWLGPGTPCQGEQRGDQPVRHACRPIPVAELRTEAAIEQPLLLGEPGERVFAMFCRPAEPRANAPAVLICNTGANPHYGYGRLGVTLARALAADGVASLRLDMSGIGDSDGAATVSMPLLYADRGDETRAAMDFLQRRGFDKVVVFGICTGAYHAMHAGLADPRVRGVVMVNQIVYRWRDSAPFFEAKIRLRALAARLRGEGGGDAEQELMRLRLAPPNPAGNTLRRVALRAAVIAERLLLHPLRLHTPASFPARVLSRLHQHGVRALVVAGRGDFAHALLQAQFGPELRDFRHGGDIRIAIEDEIDHAVGRSAARARLITLVRGFVAEFAAQAAPRRGVTPQTSARARATQPARV